jgi:hypothetical protein
MTGGRSDTTVSRPRIDIGFLIRRLPVCSGGGAIRVFARMQRMMIA